MSRGALPVLVVEDEVLIRMSLVDELEDAGFQVLEAGTADEALKMLAAHPQIEAVFTDIDMPGSMDGMKLAKFVLQSRPDMAILLTSGYLKVPKDDLPDQVAFLPKRYDLSRVANHLRGLLAR
jgi:two-component system, response regulator PdtaR